MIYAIYTESSFQVMLRVETDGGYAVTADVDAITYSVHVIDEATPIATGTLAPEDVMFDALQTDDRWKADKIGYNMLHELPHTVITDPGIYVVCYVLTCGATVITAVTDQIRARHPYTA